MEERELTQLLHQAADRVSPGPPPLARIVDEGRALRGHRSGRVRVFAIAAAAAAVVGGGSVAAVVLDLPSGGDEAADSAAGQAYEGAGGGDAGSAESAPTGEAGAGEERGTDDGMAAADAAGTLLVTPGVVQPGDTVELTPRGGAGGEFGLPWRLEMLTADGWSWEYTLVAATGGGEPTWAPAQEGPALEDPLIPAPVTLTVPPAAEPGDYRICQMVFVGDLCGSVTVTG